MSPVVRVLVVAVVRLGLLFYAGWFAFHDAPLGTEGLPIVSRIGLVLICLILSVLLGELDGLRTHFGLLVGGLRAAGRAGGGQNQALEETLTAAAGAVSLPTAASADPKASVDILIQALATKDPTTVEKVHKHLVRLTGKKLPPQSALWERWWQENRDAWAGPPAGSEGNNP
ncbi:MAG: hypothetical protein P1V36_10375 [Planctomycetota bacterium]|nr:hypothetical protein [Planctomycetota bacterium]